jgi:site-specific recombinase XerD
MLERFFTFASAVTRLRANPMGPYLDEFAQQLAQRGYRRMAVRQRVWVVAAFGRWIRRRRVGAADWHRRLIDAFARRRHKAEARRQADTAALRLFFDHLEAVGVIGASAPAIDDSALGVMKRRYEAYLDTHRALSPQTATRHWFIVSRFLVDRFGDGPMDVRTLRPADVTDYLVRGLPRRSAKSAQMQVSVLRSFFRFLRHTGDLDVDLTAAVPSTRRWRLVGVPKYLQPSEVERVLAACDRTSAVGRRNYAILLLLARLGLRGGEVVRLALDDLGWRTGELLVRGKGSVHARLPMPADVGAALAGYLHRDRPDCGIRRVFVCMKAPHRGLGHASTVSTIVRRALEQARLTPPMRGAHVLRHSLATQMLQRGASLQEIGEILRHRSPQTTEIYAKVDLPRLRELVRPWPSAGGAQ